MPPFPRKDTKKPNTQSTGLSRTVVQASLMTWRYKLPAGSFCILPPKCEYVSPKAYHEKSPLTRRLPPGADQMDERHVDGLLRVGGARHAAAGEDADDAFF